MSLTLLFNQTATPFTFTPSLARTLVALPLARITPFNFIQSPQSILDYLVDWTAWLNTNEVITGTPIVTVGAGLGLYISQVIVGNFVVWWLAGGTVGQQYNVSCTITTNQGRTDVRSFVLKVIQQ